MESTSPSSFRHSRAIELLAPYCDIADRLEAVPPSARVRGLYLKSLENIVQRAGKAELFERYFGGERWSAVRMYPLRDYMTRLAMAGASLKGVERVHEGMHDVWRTNATTCANSLLGRAMLRHGARLVILDEPFLGLERDRRRALLGQVRQRWTGRTLLYVTHDVHETRGFDRVIVMERGRIVEDGEPLVLAQMAASRYRRLPGSAAFLHCQSRPHRPPRRRRVRWYRTWDGPASI